LHAGRSGTSAERRQSCFKIDEVDRIGRGKRDVVRIREVDVRQRKGDSQRDGLSGRVGELIAHGDAVERYPQILALHRNVVGTDELQSANR